MPEQPRKKWGIGIEHEFVLFKDDGNDFREIERIHTPRGGYHQNIYNYTADNKIVRSSDIGTADKIVNVATDPTVGHGSGTYEINTLGPIGATIEKQIAKLRQAEQYIIHKNQLAYPSHRVRYMPWNSIGASSETNAGSYHFHFSLPASPSEVGSPEMMEKVKRWIANIQWVEPLMISATHGLSPLSIGDKGEEPEGSIRIVRNNYGNPGGTDIDTINPQRRYFPGREDAGNFPKHNQTNHFTRLLKVRNVSAKSGKGDIVQSGTAHSGAPPDTMEIRVFDQFDSRYLEDFMKFLVYAGSNGADRNIMPNKKAASTKEWNEAMARVLEEGWNAILPEKYIKTMRQQMGLSARRKIKSLRAIDVLGEMSQELWETNKDNDIPKHIIENRTKPNIYPINRDGWAFYMRRKLRTDPYIKEKFKKILGDLSEVDTTDSGGFISVGKYDNTHKGILHLIHKHLGENYSTEDVRDILDFLEHDGLIEIKRSPDGSMDSAKLLYTSDQIDEKLNAIANDTRMYDGDVQISELLQNIRRARRVEGGVSRRRTVHTGDRVRIKSTASLEYLLPRMADNVRTAQRERWVGEVSRRLRGFITYHDQPKIMVTFPQLNFYRGVMLALDDIEITTDQLNTQRPAIPTPSPPPEPQRPRDFSIAVGSRVRLRSEIHGVGLERLHGQIGTVRAFGESGMVRVDFSGTNYDIHSNDLELVSEQPAPSPTTTSTHVSADSNQIDARQWARRMAELKVLIRVFLNARSAIQAERDQLGWILTYVSSVRNPTIRQDYERALAQYNAAKQARNARLGRRGISSSRAFGREGRFYKKPEGPGWYVKNKDDEIRKVEIVRHRIAAIKAARKKRIFRRHR